MLNSLSLSSRVIEVQAHDKSEDSWPTIQCMTLSSLVSRAPTVPISATFTVCWNKLFSCAHSARGSLPMLEVDIYLPNSPKDLRLVNYSHPGLDCLQTLTCGSKKLQHEQQPHPSKTKQNKAKQKKTKLALRISH